METGAVVKVAAAAVASAYCRFYYCSAAAAVVSVETEAAVLNAASV